LVVLVLCWWCTTVVLLIVKFGMVLWWCYHGVSVLTTSTSTLAGRCCRRNPGVGLFVYSFIALWAKIHSVSLPQ
jgi:hypothetical protein